MRKLITALMVICIALGLVNSSAFAAGAPVSYSSAVSVVNLSGSTGNITFTYYNPDGSVAAAPTDTILAYATNIYDPLQSAVPVGFKGGLVVSSDVPLATISNLRGLDAAGKSISFASYDGFSGGTMEAYLPLLMANNYGYNTNFSVQNAGSVDTAVTIAYSDGTTNNSITALKPGASVMIDQKTETHTTAKVFSAILTSTAAPIVTGVVEYGPTLLAYGGFGSGSTMPIFPIVNANNYGYWSSVLIQNVGTVDTTVTVAYTPTLAGTACTETQTIAHGQSARFAESAFTFHNITGSTTNCAYQVRFVGSGRVTTNTGGVNSPLVSVVNQVNTSVTENKGGAYVASDQAAGGSTIVFPIIHDRNYGYWTAWFIVNNNTTDLAINAVDCRVTGKDKLGTAVDMHFKNPTVLHQFDGWLQNNINTIANGFIGGATCTGPAGSKMVGVVNQLGAGTLWNGIDSLLVYEGINP
jgi:hypothetical protein